MNLLSRKFVLEQGDWGKRKIQLKPFTLHWPGDEIINSGSAGSGGRKDRTTFKYKMWTPSQKKSVFRYEMGYLIKTIL